MLSIKELIANPKQPRTRFDEKALEDLSLSIKRQGLMQPIIVTRSTDYPAKFLIVAGERRMRAAKMAELERIPVIIKEYSDENLLELALIENIQREDLNVLEEARAYLELIESLGLTQEECAKRVSKDRTTVSNLIRLLSLPAEIQADLENEKLYMGHARALLSITDTKAQLKIRDMVIKKDLSVRQTEKLCRQLLSGKSPDETDRSKDSKNTELDYLASSLRTYLKNQSEVFR